MQYVVAGVVEEETYGRGATHLASCFRPAVGFVGEPNPAGFEGLDARHDLDLARLDRVDYLLVDD